MGVTRLSAKNGKANNATLACTTDKEFETQLTKSIKRVGKYTRRKAFDLQLPVCGTIGDEIVLKYPDNSIKVIGKIKKVKSIKPISKKIRIR